MAPQVFLITGCSTGFGYYYVEKANNLTPINLCPTN